MRTCLFALAATLSIAGLIAAPLAGAAVPPSGGGFSGGGASSGGGGGGHAGGSSGGSGGGHSGGGGYSGGHFSVGHFSGGHFSGSSYRGGGYGSPAFHASYMAHGGYVAHGSYMGGGGRPFARGGYRIIGSQSAGVAHVSAMPQGSRSARITLALGPRTGSAAKAMRLDRTVHTDRMLPRPGHPPGPRHPRHHTKYAPPTASYLPDYPHGIPFFCETRMVQPPRSEPSAGCLTPMKEHGGRKVAAAF